MKTRFPIAACIGLCLLGGMTSSSAYEITAPELASFLGISAWATKVDMLPTTYTLDICPIDNGKIMPSLIQGGQIDWSKDPDGYFKFIAGPEAGNFRISISSKTGGTLGVNTQVPVFKAVYSPALPETVKEGIYVLLADLQDRDTKLPQTDPASYKRGFVLKIAAKPL